MTLWQMVSPGYFLDAVLAQNHDTLTCSIYHREKVSPGPIVSQRLCELCIHRRPQAVRLCWGNSIRMESK